VGVERLQKVLSQAGVASRRASEQLMLEGRVTVNGATIRELGTKADAARDDIRVDGRRVKVVERYRYLLLNKPRGYVTTRSDPQRRPTVIDLLRGVREYVYPVGRLDFDSEGLLLLTNDGDLAARLTHPSHGVARVYEARVLGVPDEHELERLRKGLIISAGSAGDDERTLPAAVKVKRVLRGKRGPEALVEIVIREGRNRQVRNMCDAIGHPVVQLMRTKIGSLTLEGLRPGHVRELKPDEIKALSKRAVSTPKNASDATRPRAAARPRRSREK